MKWTPVRSLAWILTPPRSRFVRHGSSVFDAIRRIAEAQGESINTVQGRYRYGLDKLRSLLASEVCDESPTR